jgi:signal peptidase I
MNETSSQEAGSPWWLRMLVGKHPGRTMIRLAILIATAWFTFTFMLVPIRVQGVSMIPTYANGRVNLINKWAYRWRKVQRGDVVGVKFIGEQVLLLKRVVGLPGERIRFANGIIYIDGEALTEPYIKKPRDPWNQKEITLGSDQYYVVGDNREMPVDQHKHIPVHFERILGKILF